MVMDLSVPVLAEPIRGGSDAINRPGEVRESTSKTDLREASRADSRGGQVYLSDVHVLTMDDLTRAHLVLTWIGAVRGRRADYLPLNKWDETP
jgi:hypothetical protein